MSSMIGMMRGIVAIVHASTKTEKAICESCYNFT